MCLSENKCQGRLSHRFEELPTSIPEEVPRNMGYRSDSIAISRGIGPLSCGVLLLRDNWSAWGVGHN